MGTKRRRDRSRRQPGELEHDVLTILWDAGEPLTPAEVHERFGDGLALTTIATILTRLHAKGLLVRTSLGRSFRYAPSVTRSDYVSDQVRRLLARGDRSVVLQGFLDGLSHDDERALRRLLNRPAPARRKQRGS